MEASSDELIQLLSKNSKSFKQDTQKYLLGIKDDNIEIDLIVIEVVEQLLSDPIHSSRSKFNALRMIKECFQQNSNFFVSQVSESVILSIMKDLVLFKGNIKDLFIPNATDEEAKLGTSSYLLIKENLYVWAFKYPIDESTNRVSKYRQIYDELVSLGIQFSSKFNYYKPEELTNIPNFPPPLQQQQPPQQKPLPSMQQQQQQQPDPTQSQQYHQQQQQQNQSNTQHQMPNQGSSHNSQQQQQALGQSVAQKKGGAQDVMSLINNQLKKFEQLKDVTLQIFNQEQDQIDENQFQKLQNEYSDVLNFFEKVDSQQLHKKDEAKAKEVQEAQNFILNVLTDFVEYEQKQITYPQLCQKYFEIMGQKQPEEAKESQQQNQKTPAGKVSSSTYQPQSTTPEGNGANLGKGQGQVEGNMIASKQPLPQQKSNDFQSTKVPQDGNQKKQASSYFNSNDIYEEQKVSSNKGPGQQQEQYQKPKQQQQPIDENQQQQQQMKNNYQQSTQSQYQTAQQKQQQSSQIPQSMYQPSQSKRDNQKQQQNQPDLNFSSVPQSKIQQMLDQEEQQAKIQLKSNTNYRKLDTDLSRSRRQDDVAIPQIVYSNKADIAQLKTEISHYKEKINQQNLKINQLEEQLFQQQKEVEEKNQIIQSLILKSAGNQDENSKLAQQQAIYQKDRELLCLEVDQMKLLLSQKDSEIEQLQQEKSLGNRQELIDGLKSQNEELINERQELYTKIREKDMEIGRLLGAASSQNPQHEDLQNKERERFEKDRETLLQEIHEHKRTINNQSQQIQQMLGNMELRNQDKDLLDQSHQRVVQGLQNDLEKQIRQNQAVMKREQDSQENIKLLHQNIQEKEEFINRLLQERNEAKQLIETTQRENEQKIEKALFDQKLRYEQANQESSAGFNAAKVSQQMQLEQQFKMDLERLNNEILCKEFQLKGVNSEKTFLEQDIGIKQKKIELLESELQDAFEQLKQQQKLADSNTQLKKQLLQKEEDLSSLRLQLAQSHRHNDEMERGFALEARQTYNQQQALADKKKIFSPMYKKVIKEEGFFQGVGGGGSTNNSINGNQFLSPLTVEQLVVVGGGSSGGKQQLLINAKGFKGRVRASIREYFNYLPNIDLANLRAACVKKRSLLHDDRFLHVVAVSELQIVEGKQHFLNITLHFLNKSKEVYIQNVDVQYIFQPDSLKIWTKPESLPLHFEPNQEYFQQVVIQVLEVPYKLVVAELNYSVQEQKNKVLIVLPNTLNRLFEAQFINANDFKKEWSAQSHLILRTHELDLDQRLVHSPFDLQKYFPNFIEVKKRDGSFGTCRIRLGGTLILRNTQSKILVRLNYLDNNRIVIQIANGSLILNQLQENIVEYYLQTLLMIFT